MYQLNSRLGQVTRTPWRSSSSRQASFFIVLGIMVLSIGCSYSTNPIHTKDDLRFDETLIGSWKTKDVPGFGKVHLSRQSATSDVYHVQIYDENAQRETGCAEAFLCELEQKKFLSLKIEGKPESNLPKIFYLTFVIDQQTENLVKARFLNHGSVVQHLKKHPETLKHEFIARTQPPNTPELVITAETAELRNFIQSVLDKADFWVPLELKKTP